MLILSRKTGESILFPKYGIEVTVTRIEPGRVKLGVSAPRDVTVVRDDLRQFYVSTDREGGEGCPSIPRP